MLETMENSMDIDPDTAESTTAVLDAIQAFIRGQRSVLADRMDLARCLQEPHEPFNGFYNRLRNLALASEIPPVWMNSQLITSITYGIRSQETRNKLLTMRPPPTLIATLTLCHGDEFSDRNRSPAPSSYDHVYKVNPGPRTKTTDCYTPRTTATHTDVHTCGNCGYQTHPPGTICPAKDKTCDSCGKPNHFASVCRQKSRPANKIGSFHATTRFPATRDESTVTYPPTGETAPIDPVLQTLETCDDDTTICRMPPITVTILNSAKPNHVTAATPDTGACATILGTNLYHELGRELADLTHKGTYDLFGVDGYQLRPIGQTVLHLEHRGTTIKTNAVVCHGVNGLLLSWFASAKLKAVQFPSRIPNSISATTPSERIHVLKNKLLDEFADVFDDSGPLKTMKGPPMTIELVPDAVPFALPNARAIPILWRDDVKKILQDMQDQNIIAPVTKPTDWTHLLVVAAKKDGTPSICVDLTKLKKYVRRPLHHANTQARDINHRHYGQIFLDVRREARLLANPSRRREPGIDHVHHTVG